MKLRTEKENIPYINRNSTHSYDVHEKVSEQYYKEQE